MVEVVPKILYLRQLVFAFPPQNECITMCMSRRCTCTCTRNVNVNVKRKQQETALPDGQSLKLPVIQAAWIPAAWTPLSTPPPLTAVQPNTPSSSQSSLPLNLLLKSRLDCPTSERHADRTPRIRAPHHTKQHPAKFWQNNQSPILRARQPALCCSAPLTIDYFQPSSSTHPPPSPTGHSRFDFVASVHLF